jgi:uncharacterized membrane protein YqjE
MDRRAAFFALAGLICFALVPVADAKHRWVAVATGVVYLVLAVLSALDHWSRTNGRH